MTEGAQGVEGRAPLPVSHADVLDATAALGNRLHRTPMFSSASLSEATGARVFLKAELFQRTGSFKPRGMLAKLTSLAPEERERGVVGISAGNAAAGLAYGAAQEGIDCLVVMWQGASAQKLAATRAYGAAVDLSPANPGEAFDRLERVRTETGRAFVHPFDDPRVIAGHGSLGLEILEDCPDVDVIVVPIGGGGLVSGISVAVKGARPEVRLAGVEPEGSAAMHAALAAGEPLRIVPRSVADGLNAPFAGEHTLAICRELLDDSLLISEADIELGFRFLYERAKLAAEPAGAAGAAALLVGAVPEIEGKTVVVVVSGGNVAAETASGILGGNEG